MKMTKKVLNYELNMAGDNDASTDSIDDSSSNANGLTTPVAGEETVADVLKRIGVSKLHTETKQMVADSKSKQSLSSDDSAVITANNDETDDTTANQPDEKLTKQVERFNALFPDGEEDAELAAKILSNFAGDKFEAEQFLDELSGISPKRRKAIEASIEAKVTERAKKSAVKELFGREVSKEEIDTFTKFLEAGGSLALLGNLKDDDIPEEVKIDADGNELPEKTLEFLRSMKKELVSLRENQKKTDARVDDVTVNTKRQEVISDFSDGRVSSLDPLITKLKLGDEDGKDFVRFTFSKFMDNANNVKLWREALTAELDGESYEAAKLSKKVDRALNESAKSVMNRFSASNIAEAQTVNGKLKTGSADLEELSDGGKAVREAAKISTHINPNDPMNLDDAMKQFKDLQDKGILRK